MLDLERFESRAPICWECHDEPGGCRECRPDLVCPLCGTFGACGDVCSIMHPPTPLRVIEGMRAVLAQLHASGDANDEDDAFVMVVDAGTDADVGGDS